MADARVRLVAETIGPTAATPDREHGRTRYGLVGMRERTAALGGEFSAGPTPAGWRVSCRIPLDAIDAAHAEAVSSP